MNSNGPSPLFIGRIPVRDQTNGIDLVMGADSFLKKVKQDNSIYGKDLPCPTSWKNNAIDEVMPTFLKYCGPEDLSKCPLSF